MDFDTDFDIIDQPLQLASMPSIAFVTHGQLLLFAVPPGDLRAE